MKRTKKKLASIIATGISAAFFSSPVWAEESVTLHVPVKVSHLLDGVAVEVVCSVWDDTTGSLGGNSIRLDPVDGALDTTVTIVVTPAAAHNFRTATKWKCTMELSNSGPTEQITMHAPTGGPDDWKYAKPGTTLTAYIEGTFVTN